MSAIPELLALPTLLARAHLRSLAEAARLAGKPGYLIPLGRETLLQAYVREKARARRCGDVHRKVFHVEAKLKFRWRWL